MFSCLAQICVESSYVWLLGAALRSRSSIQEPSKGLAMNPAWKITETSFYWENDTFVFLQHLFSA